MSVYIPLASAVLGACCAIWLVLDMRRELKRPHVRITPRVDAARIHRLIRGGRS